jgi:hypothetical protein
MDYRIDFRSDLPRLSIYVTFRNQDVLPSVGDVLHLEKDLYGTISKKRLDRLYSSLAFKVVGREFVKRYPHSDSYEWYVIIDFNDDRLHKIDEGLGLKTEYKTKPKPKLK